MSEYDDMLAVARRREADSLAAACQRMLALTIAATEAQKALQVEFNHPRPTIELAGKLIAVTEAQIELAGAAMALVKLSSRVRAILAVEALLRDDGCDNRMLS